MIITGATTTAMLLLGLFTVTTYQPTVAQTDKQPMVTADGTHLNADTVYNLRYAAISREQLSRWGGNVQYGDGIWISGDIAGVSGLWWIHDTMDTEYYSKSKGGMVPIVNFVDILTEDTGMWKHVPVFHIPILRRK